jgi:hypothetical protein
LGSSIGFVVLFAIATFAPGTPPKPNDTCQTIMAWVTEHQSGIRWAGWCSLMAGILFLVFATRHAPGIPPNPRSVSHR